MVEVWSVDRVVAAAPDSQVEVAGRKLATGAPWRHTGFADPLLWGECRGSSKTPYQVAVNVAEPSYKCSCPSRKFPCKHCVGLLFLWAQGQLDATGELSEFASSWQSRSGPRPAGVADAGAQASPEEALATAVKRTAARLGNIVSGAAELNLWIGDQIESGFAQIPAGHGFFEPMAARMVDAQAPGLASRLRRLEGITSTGTGWPERLLAELAMLRLLARSAVQLEQLDVETPSLAANVRSHLGIPVFSAQVRQRPPVRDRWLVYGLHDLADEERVTTRRVWLRGLESGRAAVVLLFSVNGAAWQNTTLVPGIVVDADLHFYPGSPELRAVMGAEHGPPIDVSRGGHGVDLSAVQPGTVTDCAAAHAAALAQDPWIDLVPVAVRGRLHRNGAGAEHGNDVPWALTDPDGHTVRVSGWHRYVLQALATTGGEVVTVLGEWSHEGLNPLAVLELPGFEGQVIVL